MTDAKKKSPEKLSEAGLSAAFEGRIPPVKVPVLYRLGLLLVALTMVLLPLVYVGLVVLAGYGVYWHATENLTIFEGRGGGRGKVLVYIAPIVIGVVVVLFMIKPLFARPGKQPPRRSLKPGEEPLLFSFVARICEAVGAPLPRRIDVDCQVNASASFRRGLLSMLGSDLVLTLGLPLVAGLNLRELAGVLAHEFGHFAQGTGMRFTYVIRSVNGWFARVVYERDAWDEKLVQWAKEHDLRIGIILHLARLMVWLTRRILWVLMMVGHAISCFMLRQMEFDADRYEARLAGSDVFRDTALQLPLLSVASQKAFSDLQQSWSERRLGDDLAALVVGTLRQMPERVREQVLKAAHAEKTGAFDTHPATSDRIRSAQKEEATGIFRLEVPATSVFRDFSRLSRATTLLFYREHVGLPVSEENLVSTESLMKSQSETEEGLKAYQRYLQGCHDEEMPLSLDVGLPPLDDAAAALEEIQALRAKLEAALPKAKPLLSELRKQRDVISHMGLAENLNRASIRFPPASLGLSGKSPAEVARVRKAAEDKRDELRKKLAALESLLRRRWSLALQVLRSPAGKPVLEESGVKPEELDRLVGTLQTLAKSHETIVDLAQTTFVNQVLAENVDEDTHETNPKLLTVIGTLTQDWHRQLTQLNLALDSLTYPFEHARGRVSVAGFAIESVPQKSAHPGEFFPAAAEALDRLQGLAYRTRGRLALLAECVETKLAGLAPLPEPGDEEPANQ